MNFVKLPTVSVTAITERVEVKRQEWYGDYLHEYPDFEEVSTGEYKYKQKEVRTINLYQVVEITTHSHTLKGGEELTVYKYIMSNGNKYTSTESLLDLEKRGGIR